jgi:DNA-binding CsgD family transcriptional regulator
MGRNQGGVVFDHASDVYRFAVVATAQTLQDALARIETRAHSAAMLALRAINSAFHSDVQGAIALLRRALRTTCSPSDEAAYIADLLAQYLVSTGDFQSADKVVRQFTDVPQALAPAAIAMKAILQAVVGDVVTSRASARRSIAAARESGEPRLLGRVLSRCSLAAYYRGDYDEARDHALDAAVVLQAEGAHWYAAVSYMVVAAIAQDWHADGQAAAAYFGQLLVHAELAGHEALRRSALAALYNVAAELFDEASHAAIRGRLMSRPAAEQHQENFVLMVADVLGFGWKGDFGAAEAVLAAYPNSGTTSDPQRALIASFRALSAAANGDFDAARTRSRTALELTVRPRYEPLHERRSRTLARLLSAATCFIIGDRVRGQRALAERYDPGRRYQELLTRDRIDVARCPQLFRGYAAFINAASARARGYRPRYGLTPAESQLIRLLPHGATIADIAADLNKSKHTVARQVESIYQKVGARNRAQAVQKAREAGLIP